jgi:cytochrome c biogenesis factor
VTALGAIALWSAFLLAAVAAVLSTLAGASRRPAYVRGAVWALAGAAVGATIALGALCRVLVASEFAVRYVATFTSFGLPDAFKLGAIAAGPAGVLLLWTSALALAAAHAGSSAAREDLRRAPMLVLALSVVVLFALSLSAIQLPPFALVDPAPIDGLGLDPALQRPAILLATPLVLLGLGIATVAALYGAMAALHRPFSERSIGLLRRLAAVSILLLVPGVLLGIRATSQAGDGSFRFWDQLHLGAAVVLVVALAVSWAAGSAHDGEFAAFARRVVATGIGVITLGATALALRTSADVPLRDGQTTELADRFGRRWSFASQGTSRFERPPNQYVLAIAVAPRVGGQRLPLLTAEQREYVDGRGESRWEPVMVTGLSSGLLVDAQLALLEIGPGGAMVRLTLWPLRSALSAGGAIVWIGALLLLVASLGAARQADVAEQAARDAEAEAAIARWSVSAD